jgi:hypothetical protein
VAIKHVIGSAKGGGKKGAKKVMSVEGVEREEVENSESEIDGKKGEDKGGEFKRKEVEANKKNTETRENKITYGAGGGNYGAVFDGVFKIIGIKGDGFTPTETGDNDESSAPRIKMFKGIEANAAGDTRIGITESVGGESVTKFVNG